MTLEPKLRIVVKSSVMSKGCLISRHFSNRQKKEGKMQRWKRLSLGMGIWLIVGLYGLSQQICIPNGQRNDGSKCPSTKVVPELAVAIQNIRRGETAKTN